jgi:hypothetical protein
MEKMIESAFLCNYHYDRLVEHAKRIDVAVRGLSRLVTNCSILESIYTYNLLGDC